MSTDQEILNNVRLGLYNTDNRMWSSHLSNEAKEIVQCLLVVNPDDRATCADLLQMPWFASFTKMHKSTMNHLNKDVANEDIGINAMRNILLSTTSQRLKEREKGGKENEKEDKTSFWSSIF